MASVMGLMGIGLAVTAAVIFAMQMVFTANPQLLVTMFQSNLMWVIALAPLGFVFFFSSRISSMSPTGARVAFLSFASLMGIATSWIPFAYSGVTILSAFGVTSLTFGALALFGYTTKKDLSGWGRFLFMAVIGLIIAGVASFFFPQISFFVSVIGILVFSALTAYDTQKIRQMYLINGARDNLAVHGALELYLDFVNIFMYLLRLFGGSRD